MRSIIVAVMLATSSLAVDIATAPTAVAQSIEDVRAEVIAKLDAKIAVLEAEIAALEAQLADPTLSPGQAGQIRGQLNAKKAELRVCQLDLARVPRLPFRALLALNARLPDPVSPA